MSSAVKSSIKLSNIALLERARYENGQSITVVNVGDPRNSIVSSLDGTVTLVLTKDEVRQYVNISDVFSEVEQLDLAQLKDNLPSYPLNLYKISDSTVHSILFDSYDIFERESIICFSNTPESTAVLEDIVSAHNKLFGCETVNLMDLSNQLIDFLDENDESISSTEMEVDIAHKIEMKA
ncbi:hypothetical protein OCF84_20600 (plasmid) [Shewanella xiamenensis]|uniref:Uncharacterized protein n=1 Tax=Shewanella xiamenensis TaxID=332186 RepID=A0ABT6UFT2_9GAMM|nr:hypothetical protein [Shewanella xiamenensis]MDI5833330.1 hypothetical protein [Shewanella xiamenensis]WHF57918.1 hypothetical protein OCF84_20600 [Shewanella xiamenensis]